MRPSERLITFTKPSVAAARPIEGKRTEYRVKDTRRQIMSGLVLDVLPSGKKTWRVHYDVAGQDGKRKRRKPKIGDQSSPLHVVYEEWQRFHADIVRGRDPIAEQREVQRQQEIEDKRRVTFADYARQYIDGYAKKHKRSWKTDEKRLEKYILPEIGHMALGEIERRDAHRICQTAADRGAEALAERLASLITAMMNRAERDELIAHNPVRKLGRFQAEAKKRQPVPPEVMPALWPLLCAEIRSNDPRVNVTDRRRAHLVARIAFLTGLRIAEVIGAQRDELVDMGGMKPVWVLKADRAGRKRKKPHSVPLTPTLRALFTEALALSTHETQVFYPTTEISTGYQKVWYHVVEVTYREANVPKGIGLHSIRHFATTQMAFMGVDRETRDRVTDHTGPHTKGEDARYSHYDYYDEKLGALKKLEQRIHQLVTGAPGHNVVQLEAR